MVPSSVQACRGQSWSRKLSLYTVQGHFAEVSMSRCSQNHVRGIARLTGSWKGVKVMAQQLKGSDLKGLLLLSL